MRGNNDTSGIGVVEVYDNDSGSPTKLANISTRGFVETDDNALFGGFIVGGQNDGMRVLVRAVGPSLKSRLAEALDDPELEIFDGNGSPIAFNDDWNSSERRTEIEETGIAPQSQAECAVLLNVSPGAYTAIVRGKDRTTGVGLVEVYHIK